MICLGNSPAHKNYLNLVSLFDIISVIGIYKILIKHFYY